MTPGIEWKDANRGVASRESEKHGTRLSIYDARLTKQRGPMNNPDDTFDARAVWFAAPRSAELRPEKVPPPGP